MTALGRRSKRLSFVTVLLGVFSSVDPTQALPDEGLKAQILSVKIPADRRPVVIFQISDGKGNPLDRAAVETIRFTIAALKVGSPGQTAYHSYVVARVAGRDYVYRGQTKKPALAESTQPTYDRDGTFMRIKPGVHSYTFKTVLPADYDKKATHVVGAELTRDNRKYVANPVHEFIPAGGRVKTRRIVVETASCNNCHDPLEAHGGLRRETTYCALCHTSQLVDPETGENLDFRFMVHRIHRGKDLASVKGGVPFLAVGNRQAVSDFSHVGYPQDLRNCGSCHTRPQGNNWMNVPSITACTSCHDNVNVTTGENHAGGAQTDETCVACHQPDGVEFGLSVRGAHIRPSRSEQLPGVVFDILKIEGGGPGENLAVTFSLKNKKGEPLDAARMDNLRLVMAWPTIDYRASVEEDVRKAEASGPGVYTYEFKTPVPGDATGSGALAIQGYKSYELKKPDGSVIKGVRDVGINVVKYFPITDRAAVPRRTVVKTEKCNTCHESIAFHGEARKTTEYCVFCHISTRTDEEKRKTAKGSLPSENVHFKYMIHGIHKGKDLGRRLVIYGGSPASPAPVDFSHVHYPGDLRNCEKCHEKGTYELPLAEGLSPTVVPQSDGKPLVLPPITAACISCHVTEQAKAHIEIQTAAGGRESCTVCHAAGRAFPVLRAHAR